MKLIISPTKKMVVNTDDFDVQEAPIYLEKTRQVLAVLQNYSDSELKDLWHTSDRLTQINADQLRHMDLAGPLTPAVMSYSGIQFQSMAPGILTGPALKYLQRNLRILSGFYGILKPFDGVVPYRLEMQSHLQVNGAINLYHFWGDSLYRALDTQPGEPIINLASKEYAKAITPFLTPTDQWIDIVFGHLVAGKVKTRATLAKMARGEMVRYIAEHQLTKVSDLQSFDSPRYAYDPHRSTTTKLVFLEAGQAAASKPHR